MKFHLQAVPHIPVAPATPAVPAAAPAPAFVDRVATSPAIPNIRIQRIEAEGCGPISASSLREGFRDAWQRGNHTKSDWSDRTGELFRSPLALKLAPGLGGREIGRRLAEAILSRAATSSRRT